MRSSLFARKEGDCVSMCRWQKEKDELQKEKDELQKEKDELQKDKKRWEAAVTKVEAELDQVKSDLLKTEAAMREVTAAAPKSSGWCNTSRSPVVHPLHFTPLTLISSPLLGAACLTTICKGVVHAYSHVLEVPNSLNMLCMSLNVVAPELIIKTKPSDDETSVLSGRFIRGRYCTSQRKPFTLISCRREQEEHRFTQSP